METPTTPQLKMAISALDMCAWCRRASVAFLETYSRARGEDVFDYESAIDSIRRLAVEHQTVGTKTLFAIVDAMAIKNKG